MDTSFDMFHETEVPEGELIISRTDLRGIITYVNETFAHISGYDADELIGKPHSILRHPDMPKAAFAELWKTIEAGKTWEGYVKNLRKDKGFYWVLARVSPVVKNGEVVAYKSLRAHVPKPKRIEMQNTYDQMRMDAGEPVRIVAYLDNADYRRLAEEAENLGISPNALLHDKLK